jgi:hypothetical protein
MTITVTAKINAGIHPRLGAIIQGQSYCIEESDFSPVLFERANNDSPLPRQTVGAENLPPAVTPAKPGKKGR